MVLDGHVYGVMGFLMNGKLFDSFTPEQQQLLMDAADEAGVYEREVRRTSEAEQLEKLKDCLLYTSHHDRFRDSAEKSGRCRRRA